MKKKPSELKHIGELYIHSPNCLKWINTGFLV